MATDIDILLPRTPTKTKRVKVGFTSQFTAFQGAGQCNVICQTCEGEKLIGACILEAGHTGNHRCNNGHQWAAKPGEITGPH
jgi:hypothetical protein